MTQRIFGWDETVTSCDCCGKVELSGTFAVETDTGEMLHYGSTCVKRNTGVKNPTSAANAYLAERRTAARREIEATKENKDYRRAVERVSVLVDRGEMQPGVESAAAVRAESLALRVVTERINAAHRL